MEEQTKKPLEILVIEDTPEFMEVAKSVYDNDENIRPNYAFTYEEAMGVLRSKKVDMVVTDLFLPSQIDWKGKYASEIEENINSFVDEQRTKLSAEYSEEEIKEAEKQVKEKLKPKNPFALDYVPVKLSPAYNKIEFIEDTLKRLEEYRGLKENPAGLGIASYCLEHSTPFVTVSQGERHEGNLAIVRKAVQEIKEFKGVSNDFLMYALLYGGGEVDKKKPQVWEDAVKYVKQLYDEHLTMRI